MSRLDDRCKKLGKMKRELGRLSRELDEKGETMQVEAKIVGSGRKSRSGSLALMRWGQLWRWSCMKVSGRYLCGRLQTLGG